MKVVVCVKAVPGFVTKVQVAETQDRVNYESGSIIMNESDEYALEAALAFKKEFGGEISVITAGPLASQPVLHTGLAKGADSAMRVDADFTDCERISMVLAEAIRSTSYDLILTGVESSDNMAAQVGISIAVRLGLPFAYAVTKVELGPSSEIVKVTKEVGGGVEQVLEIPLPALLCIQSGVRSLSYTSVRKLFQARQKQIECFTPDDLSIDEELGKVKAASIMNVFPAGRARRAEIIEGKPSEVAPVLIKKVKEAL